MLSVYPPAVLVHQMGWENIRGDSYMLPKNMRLGESSTVETVPQELLLRFSFHPEHRATKVLGHRGERWGQGPDRLL